MKIQEYWATLVAAGLAPDWKDVVAYADSSDFKYYLQNVNEGMLYAGRGNETNIKYVDSFSKLNPYSAIQLRKDGIDLVSLEWYKSTKEYLENYSTISITTNCQHKEKHNAR